MENTAAKAPGRAAPHKILKTMTKVHVFLHRISGGRLGNTMGGDEVCFVTMTGAKSGREITIPLIHVPHGEGVLLVASQTGRDTHPLWYNNLVKNPEIAVRHRRDQKKLRAREATTEEKAELSPICDETYGEFAQYRARTARDIPIFVCESA